MGVGDGIASPNSSVEGRVGREGGKCTRVVLVSPLQSENQALLGPEHSRRTAGLLHHMHGPPSVGAHSSFPLISLLSLMSKLRDPRKKFSNSDYPLSLIPLLGR